MEDVFTFANICLVFVTAACFLTCWWINESWSRFTHKMLKSHTKFEKELIEEHRQRMHALIEEHGKQERELIEMWSARAKQINEAWEDHVRSVFGMPERRKQEKTKEN